MQHHLSLQHYYQGAYLKQPVRLQWNLFFVCRHFPWKALQKQTLVTTTIISLRLKDRSTPTRPSLPGLGICHAFFSGCDFLGLWYCHQRTAKGWGIGHWWVSRLQLNLNIGRSVKGLAIRQLGSEANNRLSIFMFTDLVLLWLFQDCYSQCLTHPKRARWIVITANRKPLG